MHDLAHVAKSLVIGFGTGVFSGTFGVGGGVLSTPAIRMILGAPALIALGTPLPVVLPTSLTGALNYHRLGLIDWRVVRDCVLAGFGGSVLGSLLTPWVGGPALMIITALVVLIIGVDFASGSRQKRLLAESELGPPPDFGRRTLAIGFIAGFLSGLLGIGGGVLMVPAFIVGLRLKAKKAFGTSLVIVACLAIPGTLIHWRLGHIDWWLVLWLTLGVIPGAHLGSTWALRAREGRLINGFGLFLVAVAMLFAWQEIAPYCFKR